MFSTAFFLFIIGFVPILWAQGMPLSFKALEFIDYRLVYFVGITTSIVGFFMIIREYRKDNINAQSPQELKDLKPVVISILTIYNAICIPGIMPETEKPQNFTEAINTIFSHNFVDSLKELLFNFENIKNITVWVPLAILLSSFILFPTIFSSSKKVFKVLSIISATIIIVTIIAFIRCKIPFIITSVDFYNLNIGLYMALILSVLAIVSAFIPTKQQDYGLPKKEN